MRLKQLTTLLAEFITPSAASVFPIDTFKTKEQVFLEYMLLQKIDEECNSTLKKVKSWGISLLGYIITNYSCIKYYGHIIKNEKWNEFIYDTLAVSYSADKLAKYLADMQQFQTGSTLCYLVGFSAAFIIYKLYNLYYKKRSTYNTYVKFIKNWQEYKKVTPTEFHSLFDELYEKQHNNSLSKNEVYEAIGFVNQILQ